MHSFEWHNIAASNVCQPLSEPNVRHNAHGVHSCTMFHANTRVHVQGVTLHVFYTL